MKNILVVIDMQNDFITGTLGTREAVAIVPAVVKKMKSYDRACIYATRDTHKPDYLRTQEGRMLPVEHCIIGTEGWQLAGEIAPLVDPTHIINKHTFGSEELAKRLSDLNRQEQIEIALVGLCTDICVVSNALLLKAFMPEVKITVDPACCAGVTVESHNKALDTMRSCQVIVQ